MIDLHSEVLFGLPILIKETRSTVAGYGQGIEYMVPTLDREVAFDCPRLFEALIATLRCIQLRLEVGIGEEEKSKVAPAFSNCPSHCIDGTLAKISMTGRDRQPGCARYAEKCSAADGAHAFYFKANCAGLVTINIAC
jgi:hypothetical protein